MSGVDIAGLVEDLVRAVSLRCHSHPGEERRSATERAAAAKQALLDALIAQAAELADANRWGDILDAEQSAIAAALPGVRFMDPPDGGSPSLAEQVKRMREALDAAEKQRDEALAALKAAREALDGIYTYCNDTLSGRADGGLDDRAWQREAVIRARNLARPFARPDIEAAIRARATPSDPGTEQREAGR